MKKITRLYKSLVYNFKPKIDIDKNSKNFETLDEIFNYYGTDKGSKVKNQYDKNSDLIIGHGFSKYYEKHFLNFKNDSFNLLEIGTWHGASSAAFAIYFPKANIYGIDRNFKFRYKSNRIKFINCDLTIFKDLEKLGNILNELKFKIIIDDGSHVLTHIMKNLKTFLNRVESNCYYVIEDFNAPKDEPHLNDGKGEEILIEELFQNIKEKKKFKSKIMSEDDQQFLFENIKEIHTYKGNHRVPPYFSNIAFLKKK